MYDGTYNDLKTNAKNAKFISKGRFMFKIIRRFVEKPTEKKVLEKVNIDTPFEKKPRTRAKNKE